MILGGGTVQDESTQPILVSKRHQSTGKTSSAVPSASTNWSSDGDQPKSPFLLRIPTLWVMLCSLGLQVVTVFALFSLMLAVLLQD